MMKMKYIFINLIIFWSFTICKSQNGIITNYGFEQTNCEISPCLGNLNPDCVPDWSTSHGTPYIFQNSGPTGNVAFMWYGGEGIFAEIDFREGKTYDICLLLRTDMLPTPTEIFPDMPNFIIRAANGLEHSPSVDPICNEMLPTNGIELFSEPVSTYFNQTLTVTINDFQPTINYNQLLISHDAFPKEEFYLPLGIYVDEVRVFETCVDQITFNNEEIEDARARKILVFGESYSPSNEDIELIAGEVIQIVGEFQASPSGQGSLWLKTARCGDGGYCKSILSFQDDNPSAMIHNQSNIEKTEVYKKYADEDSEFYLTIFPNPTSGKVTMKYHLKESSKVQFKLTNLEGIQLLNIDKGLEKAIGNHIQELDLKDYPPGIYYLEIQTSERVVVKKIVKN